MDENNVIQLGKKVLRAGECTFFLHPGESIPQGIQNVHVLTETEGLVIRATEDFDDNGIARSAGDRWMIKGKKPWRIKNSKLFKSYQVKDFK